MGNSRKIKCPKCGLEVEEGTELCSKCKEPVKDHDVYRKMLKELEQKQSGQ